MKRRIAENLGLTSSPAFLLFDGNCRLWGSSEEGGRWLRQAAPDAQSAIREALRRFLRTRRASAAVVLEVGELTFTRLALRGSVRTLVELPSRRERTANENRLSRTQLQIARRAARGETLREIARAVGRAPDTVRSHLREVYRRLDVASRLELSRALEEPDGGR